jgi:predicted metalloprotease
MVSRLGLIALATLAALLLLAGCGGDEGSSSDSTPVAVNEAGEVDVDEADPDATEEPGGPETLDDFQELRQAEDSQSVPAIRGSAGLSTPEWIHTVDGDVASYWQQQFNDAGYRYRPATEFIFDTTADSACGQASPRTGPFYCTLDEGIYLPVEFFDKVANPFGDAATAIVVAHENGHRVQDLLGIFDQRVSSVQIELQADCLAGVWAKTVFDRGLLEEGDIGEILGLVELSGDAPGTPINSQGAHGNSQLRQKFFAQGYDGGEPGSCPVPRKSEIRALL